MNSIFKMVTMISYHITVKHVSYITKHQHCKLNRNGWVQIVIFAPIYDSVDALI